MSKIRQNKRNKRAIDDSEIAGNYRSSRRKFLLSPERSPIKITRMFFLHFSCNSRMFADLH